MLQIEILFERLETRSPSGKADRPTASPRRHTEDRATAARARANPAIPDIFSPFPDIVRECPETGPSCPGWDLANGSPQ